MAHVRHGRFQPWGGTGFGSARGMSFWQRAWSATDRRFLAKPYSSSARNAWQRAGRWGSRVGVGVTAVSAGWNQWQADADDPSMGDAERVARGATMGATTAGGALLGAKGGAWAGGAIGTAICPGVGTVVGGVVGGVLGGAVGGFAGSEAGQAVIDEVGDFAEETSEWAGDRVDDAGDMLTDAGDALTFWD